jgi:transcriptional regulator with XRE-family HTH domain
MTTMKKKAVRPDIRERFGFAIKSRREELGLTQEKLAAQAGIHRTYLGDVERGARNVCLMNIDRLAAALALRLPDLFKLVDPA